MQSIRNRKNKRRRNAFIALLIVLFILGVGLFICLITKCFPIILLDLIFSSLVLLNFPWFKIFK